jgi:biopolymer transport protein ExbD
VELNLAAMLDMAFQLLTFFILTFRPSPIEGQVSLHLPPPQPVTNVNATQSAGSDTSNTNPAIGLNSLVISAYSTPNGSLATMAIGEGRIDNVSTLDSRLRAILSEPGSPFDQVIIQVSSSLRYEELMKIIDVCTKQLLPSGSKLTKLSFVELPEGPGVN